MLVAGIICTVIAVIALIVGFHMFGKALDQDNAEKGYWSGTIVTTGAYLLIFGLTLMIGNGEKPKPTALDVYQNKTTLQYTMQDSTTIDSTVVWKKGCEPK